MKVRQESAESLVYQGMKEYSAYVSKSRVLPYLDGLKPVFRRVLYSMMKLKAYDRMFKSSNILGDTIKLHPHGSGNVYGAMQTLVSSPNSLIEGKGNWGNGIYSPYMAAERYTEARLSPVFCELLDSDFETLGEFVPSYDETSVEPRNIEFKLPVAELIGISGIGVALIVNCPALHVSTVINKTLSVLDNRPVEIKYAYGSSEYKNKIYPDHHYYEKDGKSWLSITSIPTGRYLDPITEDSLLRELFASGQLIIDDRSQVTKGIISFNVCGPTFVQRSIVNKLAIKPINNFSYYDNKIKFSGYYENWVAAKLKYLMRKLNYHQIKQFNKNLNNLALSQIHEFLENHNVKGREGFIKVTEEIGNKVYDEYEAAISPYLEHCKEWIKERSDFLSSLRGSSLNSLKHYDITEAKWHLITEDDAKQTLISDIEKINKKLFSPASKPIKSLPNIPNIETRITKYVALRSSNQVEIRFKKIPRVTNWVTDDRVIIIYEDGSQLDLKDDYFGLYEDSSKKVVGFTFPNTVTIFVTDSGIQAYTRLSKITEIIKSAFPCKRIKIGSRVYKVSGGKSWDPAPYSIIEP